MVIQPLRTKGQIRPQERGDEAVESEGVENYR